MFCIYLVYTFFKACCRSFVTKPGFKIPLIQKPFFFHILFNQKYTKFYGLSFLTLLDDVFL